MQGMVAGKRSRGKPRQIWEKDITDTFGTMAAASRVAEDRHQFRKETSGERRPGEDVLREEEQCCSLVTSISFDIESLCLLPAMLLLFLIWHSGRLIMGCRQFEYHGKSKGRE